MSIQTDGTMKDDIPNEEKLAKYDSIRAEAEELYKSFGKVFCPAFNTSHDAKNHKVHFTSEGFNHLIYRIKKQERDKRAQIMRFELLLKAKELLEKTSLVQEYDEYTKEIRKQSFKKTVTTNVKIRDWGFVGIIGRFRIKVVVRQIGEGERKFCSVIPAWETKYYKQVKIVRNTKGNVAED
ncbi:MAG: hypothetical protein WCV55_01640 [Candidatus Paceibacterota bacterium]